MSTPTSLDNRYGVYGWDHSKQVPKEGDLVVIIDVDNEFNNRIMRLVEDRSDRQTVAVCDNLTGNYGLIVRFNRKGDLRSLTSNDKVALLPDES